MEAAHAMTSPAAGWFSDPQAPHLLRWWDGMQWTHHVQPHPAATQGHAPAAALQPVDGYGHAGTAQGGAGYGGAGYGVAHHGAAEGSQQHSAAGHQAIPGYQQAGAHHAGHHGTAGSQQAPAHQHAAAAHLPGVVGGQAAAGGHLPGVIGYQTGSTIGGLPASGGLTSSGGAAALELPASGSGSLMETNPRSLTAIGISALYLFIAIATGVVLMGIVPALFTFRAFENRERLAPAALVAAVIAIGFAVTHTHVT